ncbi:MAG TPA: CRISPR-associated protein Cas4 [Thermoanaerobaculia bacterium]|nr:CRISPR-associated protein Cas4 [Thermoanaerobaculia bacterium]
MNAVPPTAAEPLPLSALQHLVFCERQFALIHVERQWADNPLTVDGKALHEQADAGGSETRGDVRILRGLALRCERLALVGKADVVELHRTGGGDGARLPGADGCWRPFPVEYKRGRPKLHDADRVQLCAQAFCLEEMLAVPVPAGALFYGKTRRREEVAFDPALRQRTETAAARAAPAWRST